MLYRVTWSEGAKETVHAMLATWRPTERPGTFFDTVTAKVAQEIEFFPQAANAQPGVAFAGDLRVARFRVRYEIHKKQVEP